MRLLSGLAVIMKIQMSKHLFNNDMKYKQILRFYFNVDELERALDNLILTHACRSADCVKGGEHYAEKILALIGAKEKLSELWQYLDSVISALKSDEVQILKSYALMRYGIRRLDKAKQRAIRRVVIKFTRHARSLERYAEGVYLVGEYYCLI